VTWLLLIVALIAVAYTTAIVLAVRAVTRTETKGEK
jgi:hypothetical protein